LRPVAKKKQHGTQRRFALHKEHGDVFINSFIISNSLQQVDTMARFTRKQPVAGSWKPEAVFHFFIFLILSFLSLNKKHISTNEPHTQLAACGLRLAAFLK